MSLTIFLDTKRCSGCQACMVACMDQNDLMLTKKQEGYRQVFQREITLFTEININYISLACMHCEDAPCQVACPTGSIIKDAAGIIRVRQELCIGCHSCSLACPFGIPRFSQDGKMQKCELCSERIKHGLEPACVHTCPTKALKLGDVNEISQHVEDLAATRIISKVF